MKRNSIIWIIIATWFVGLVGVFFSTKMAVDKKEKKLWMQAHNALSDYFDNQSTYMDVVYSGRTVAYEQISIPDRPQKRDNPQSDWQRTLNDSYGKYLEQWKSEYGDIWKLYKLKPKYKSENSWNSDNEWTGWMFHGLECINAWNGVIEFIEYPYQVGLKKQDYNFFYNFMPTIQEALNSAYEFETEDPKSSNRDKFAGGNKSNIWNLKGMVENEYFFLWSYDDNCNSFGKESVDSMLCATDWSKYHIKSAYSLPSSDVSVRSLVFAKSDYPGVYNGYYQVYNRLEKTAVWRLTYNWYDDNKSRNLKKYRIRWAAILTILMLGSVIPLSIIENKKKKMSEETLQDRLKRLCNPQNFMKNYDTKKVETANALYQRLMTVALGEQALNEISQTAITELGITLIDETQLKKLKEKVNPQRYMKPYDAEKVSLANELFAKINKSGLTYEEYIEIEKESKKL
ncbi:MAG: hypothetical protein IJ789_05090 [Bacteroidales bacterium]|nr:hypothetical protein [Bacteroidales bacterium]MBR1850731.1 hypothetical protein [Bacteroidales bacterium]